MTRDELLERLQPLPLPVEPGPWPPAIAWWILLGLLILGGLCWLLWLAQRHRYRHYYQARTTLDAIADAYRNHHDAQRLLLQLACWLREFVITTHPDPDIKTMHGDEWLAFLERDLPGPSFSRGPGRVFGEALYRAEPQFDSQAVLQLCYRWLASKRRQGRNHAAV